MFSQLLVPSEYADKVNEFRERLQSELVSRGERAAVLKPYAIPVDYADPLEGFGQYYIRVHQHRLSDDELNKLIEELSLVPCNSYKFG